MRQYAFIWEENLASENPDEIPPGAGCVRTD